MHAAGLARFIRISPRIPRDQVEPLRELGVCDAMTGRRAASAVEHERRRRRAAARPLDPADLEAAVAAAAAAMPAVAGPIGPTEVVEMIAETLAAVRSLDVPALRGAARWTGRRSGR